MPVGERVDPYGHFNFMVDIEGMVAGFAEVSGVTTDTDVIEYRDGSDVAMTVRKQPGLRKYVNIVLKRGFTQDKRLWDWRKQVINGLVTRKSGSIVLRDEAQQEVLRWNFRDAWPVKWEGPSFNAKTSEAAIESLELAHEGVELV